MTFRRIRFLAVAVVLFTLFLGSGLAQHTDPIAAVPNAGVAKTSSAWPAANWTFVGCWTQFSAGQCRDIFRDQQGNAWICRQCGTTGNPGPGKCNPISDATLNSGFWCS
jgi:hypothetical protein